MLSSPLTQCWLEGAPIVQASCWSQSNTGKGERAGGIINVWFFMVKVTTQLYSVSTDLTTIVEEQFSTYFQYFVRPISTLACRRPFHFVTKKRLFSLWSAPNGRWKRWKIAGNMITWLLLLFAFALRNIFTACQITVGADGVLLLLQF